MSASLGFKRSSSSGSPVSYHFSRQLPATLSTVKPPREIKDPSIEQSRLAAQGCLGTDVLPYYSVVSVSFARPAFGLGVIFIEDYLIGPGQYHNSGHVQEYVRSSKLIDRVCSEKAPGREQTFFSATYCLFTLTGGKYLPTYS